MPTDEQEIAGDRPASGAQPPSADELTFPLPFAHSLFVDLCGFLVPVAIVFLAVPHLPAPIRYWALLVTVTIFVLPRLLLWLWSRTRAIRISGDGITVGRTPMQWQDIAEMRKGVLRLRPLVLVPKGWARTSLGLPPHPLVFDEVVPEILRRCPQILVSRRAQQTIDNPETVTEIPRWASVPLLGYGLVLGAVPFLLRHGDIPWAATGPAMALVLLPIVLSVCVSVRHKEEQCFVAESVSSPMLLALALLCAFFADIPLHPLDALAVLGCTLCLAGAVVAALRAKLEIPAKAAILLTMVSASAFAYGIGARQALPRKEITHLLGGGMFTGPFVWSADGELLVPWMSQEPEKQRVVDLRGSRSIPLPMHEGVQITRWLDRSHVIRHVIRTVPEGRQYGLYAFSLSQSRERCLGEVAGRTDHLRGECVSPNGMRVCWLELTGEGPDVSLKMYDMREGRTETVDVLWPEDDVDWTCCAWAGDEEIVVIGYSKTDPESQREPAALHILRVTREGDPVSYAGTSHMYHKWYVSPDFRHAFGITVSRRDPMTVDHVNLLTGQAAAVSNGPVLKWQENGRYALRIVTSPGRGIWLCRFDMAEVLETRVFRLSPGEEFIALSSCGRFAIFTTSPPRRLHPLALVNLGTGERLRLSHTFWVALGMSPSLPQSWLPGFTFFSPDGTQFLIESMVLLEQRSRVYLYSVPKEWLKK